MVHEDFFENSDYFTSDFLKQCKQNENFPQFLLKYIKDIIKQIYLVGRLYSQVVMIRGFVLKTKVAKEDFVKDEYQNNDSAMNTQNEYENYMYSALV